VEFNLQNMLASARIEMLIRSGVIIFVGLPAVFFLSRWTRSYFSRRFSAQQGMIFSKIVFYTGGVLVFISLFRELGFSLTPLLGAAGIVGIAVGFASQTSVSNIISGLFLLAEKPFVVDDIIIVGDLTGQVLSIDILSIKIRTFDNRFVRIPNETIIKSQVINATRFPIRRIDVKVSAAYKEDVRRVRELLFEIAHNNPLCLEEPEPIVIFSGFGSSSIDFLFGVWAQKVDFIALKNSIQAEIKEKFEAEGIEIPFPHLSLYTGLATEPLPVKVVGE
jgi:small-conductance mechanosensitive channel